MKLKYLLLLGLLIYESSASKAKFLGLFEGDDEPATEEPSGKVPEKLDDK